jgi:uncharacterized damage-inducible protein DinB
MTVDTFVLLAKYNQEVNERMKPLIASLGAGEWDRRFEGFFPSIRSLCSHIYICDFNWLKRIGGLREFNILKEELFGQNIGFGELLFPDREGYFEKRPELDKKIIELVNEIGGEELPQIVKYKDSEGNPHAKPLEGALLHVFTHQIHHRGMISLYLELLGKQNDFSGLLPAVY